MLPLKNASHLSSSLPEISTDVSRVGKWATDFNSLLEDPIGLHTFSEFLKKEFSHENIAFWVSCERYKQQKNQTLMEEMAKEIYSNHLCIGAPEPVNIDSCARQMAKAGLDTPTQDLFLPAQRQIFNLMKFDCYQRFLKSSLFKDCLQREMQGQPLLHQSQSCDLDSFKRKECVDMKKRKTLISWPKLNKSKSNEPKNSGKRLWEKHYTFPKSLKKKKALLLLDDHSSTLSDMTDSSFLDGTQNEAHKSSKNLTSSRESLNSAELTLFPANSYCRVILPDLSTTVVETKKGETVGEMLLSLLEKRSLTYNAVEAYLVGSKQPIDQCTDVTTLSSREIKVQQVILFCLELPNRRTVGVKAKSNKTCGDILKPVLLKYGYKMDKVKMTVTSTEKVVAKTDPITSIDNLRIIVQLLEHSSSDPEDLTNQIFDDLLKTRPEYLYSGPDVERDTTNPVSSNIGHAKTLPRNLDKIPSKARKTDNLNLISGNKHIWLGNHCRLSYHGEAYFSYDTNSIDLSCNKENGHSSSTPDVTNHLHFNNDETILASSLQKMDPSFSSSDPTFKNYLQRHTKLLDNAFESSSRGGNGNVAPSLLPSSPAKLLDNAFESSIRGGNGNMSPPLLPPRISSCSSLSVATSAVISDDSFEVDADMDVTLKAQSEDLSRLSFKTEVRNETLKNPPPVPPKFKAPPPRPPSKQSFLSHSR